MNKRGKKKIMPIVIGILLIIIGVGMIAVTSIANKNVPAMNSCVDSVLETLGKNYTVTPVDVGDYKQMKVYGIMKFDVEQYHIEELGNLSVMRLNMGIMQMSTIVITPFDKNLPLLSADYMYIMGNRKAYLEFYDVVKEKDDAYNTLMGNLQTVVDKYNHLEDFEAKAAWYEHLLTVDAYKSCTDKNDAEIEQMLIESLDAYIAHAKSLPLLSEEEKAEKLAITLEYTNGLVDKGGVSTDVFKKELGVEETKKFFDQVFFGTSAQ